MDLPSKVDETTQTGSTAALASRLTALDWSDVTPEAATVAKQCLLDWLGVSIAARDEPLVKILMDEFAEGGESTIIGSGRRARLHDAVLINGAMSHALDFDDVITAMNGHPTVPVAPVAIGLAEALGQMRLDLDQAALQPLETLRRLHRCRIVHRSSLARRRRLRLWALPTHE